MQKILLLSVLAGIPSLWNPAWGQAPSVGKSTTQNQKKQAPLAKEESQPDNRGTKESPLFVDSVSDPKNADDAAKEEREEHHKATVDGWTLGIAAAVAAFTGLLVYVGWRGVNAANRTLAAIERQGGLMQAQFDQWVDLRNWKVNRSSDMLFAIVDLTNPTAFPVTITNGYIAVHMAQGKVTRTNLDGIVLSPSNPTPIRFDILDLSPWNDGQARGGYAELSGIISHAHRISGHDISRPFAGRLYFNNLVKGEWEANFVQLSTGEENQQGAN